MTHCSRQTEMQQAVSCRIHWYCYAMFIAPNSTQLNWPI